MSEKKTNILSVLIHPSPLRIEPHPSEKVAKHVYSVHELTVGLNVWRKPGSEHEPFLGPRLEQWLVAAYDVKPSNVATSTQTPDVWYNLHMKSEITTRAPDAWVREGVGYVPLVFGSEEMKAFFRTYSDEYKLEFFAFKDG